MNRNSSTQSLVRNLLKAYGEPLRKRDIRDMIGLSGENGYGRVNNAVISLVKTGEVEKTGYGRYRWKGDVLESKYCKKQTAIWRFMWIRSKKNDPFTAIKVHEMTGIGLYTVKAYITFLVRSGYLEKIGTKRAFKTKAPLYLIASEKMNTNAPVMRKRRKTHELEEKMERARFLATSFFTTVDLKTTTIQGLIETTKELGQLLEECNRMALSLRKKNVK